MAWLSGRPGAVHQFAGLKPAVIRVGRSVLVDELRFIEFLRQRSEIRPAPDRRLGPRAGDDE